MTLRYRAGVEHVALALRVAGVRGSELLNHRCRRWPQMTATVAFASCEFASVSDGLQLQLSATIPDICGSKQLLLTLALVSAFRRRPSGLPGIQR